MDDCNKEKNEVKLNLNGDTQIFNGERMIINNFIILYHNCFKKILITILNTVVINNHYNLHSFQEL